MFEMTTPGRDSMQDGFEMALGETGEAPRMLVMLDAASR